MQHVPPLPAPSTAPSRAARRLAAVTAAFALAAAAFTADAQTCSVSSPAVAPLVVELYTSEGCSSCPPADRWLSTLKGRSDVLPLAFHVGYWNHLGWVDRFAKPEFTERQRDWARRHGSRSVYTPQAVVDGRDWRTWPKLPAPAGPAAADAALPRLTLTRAGEQVVAEVAPGRGAGWQAYWAVVEDGHGSRVSAGENAGATLLHDHVVRLWQPVAGWSPVAGLRTTLAVSRGVPEHPRRVAFVVVDAASQRPLQAAVLGC